MWESFSFACTVPMMMEWLWVAESEGNVISMPELILHSDPVKKLQRHMRLLAYMCFRAVVPYLGVTTPTRGH